MHVVNWDFVAFYYLESRQNDLGLSKLAELLRQNNMLTDLKNIESNASCDHYPSHTKHRSDGLAQWSISYETCVG